MHTLCMTHGAANPRRFRVGERVRFIDPPIIAAFVPSGTTGVIRARTGYRALEIECDGTTVAVTDFPENLEKATKVVPYIPAMKFVSRRNPC